MTPKLDDTLTIVVLLHRDEATLREIARQCIALRETTPQLKEILLINSASPDRCGVISKEIELNHPGFVKAIDTPMAGYGLAVLTGIKAAKSNWISIIDGDLEYKVEDISLLFSYRSSSEMILSFRYVKRYSRTRRFVSYIYNNLIKLRFGIDFRDVGSGLRIYHRETLLEFDFKSNILSFLYDNNQFDYNIIISPRILLKSEIKLDNFDVSKINVLLKQNFLILFHKDQKLNFIDAVNYLHNEPLLYDFNFLTSNKNICYFENLNYSVLSKFQTFYDNRLVGEKGIEKIGVCFTGISHDDGKYLSGWSKKFKRSFVFTYENHFEMIINPFNENYSVKTYLTTYDSEHTDSLLKIYKPSSYLILDGLDHTMRSTYIKSIQNLIMTADDVDFFICTRFDIKFYDKLVNWNFDYNKFNFLFKEIWGCEKQIEITDVLFAMPGRFLQPFLNAIIKADKKPRREECTGELHYIYDYIVEEIGKDNIHFICDEYQSTANAVGEKQKSNTFFYLCRE